MNASLFTWIVWHDRAPLQSPKELGWVQAPNIVAARAEAATHWPGLPLLVQSATSAKVHPYSAHPTSDAPLASETSRANYRHPRKHNPSKARQLEFNATKRAAHAAEKQPSRAMTTDDRRQG